MKPPNSPTQGQPNPRKIRVKVAFGPRFPTADNFSWVGIDFMQVFRLRETQPNQILREYPIFSTNRESAKAKGCAHEPVSARCLHSRHVHCVCLPWFGENRLEKFVQDRVIPFACYTVSLTVENGSIWRYRGSSSDVSSAKSRNAAKYEHDAELLAKAELPLPPTPPARAVAVNPFRVLLVILCGALFYKREVG